MLSVEEHDERACQGCGGAAAEHEHTCPYNEDIHGDYVTTCNCCEGCQRECAMEI